MFKTELSRTLSLMTLVCAVFINFIVNWSQTVMLAEHQAKMEQRQ